MATPGVPLRVQISADLADIKKGLAVLRGDLAKVKKDASSAGPDTSAWVKGLHRIRSGVLQVAAAYASLRTVRAYLDLADQAANLSARLKLATDSQESFNKAQSETFKIAQRTSAQWESVVDLYARLAMSTDLAQDQVLSLAETITQTFALSGASTQEQANGLRQLTQALAGGVLRAEEYNSLVETNFRLVKALADGLGIATSEVRKYVNDGKITSRDFVNALTKAQEEIAEEYAELPLTVGRAIQQVRNSLIKLVGDSEQSAGATRDLAGAIQGLARVLESDDTKRGLASFVEGIADILRFVTQALPKLQAVGQEVVKLQNRVDAFGRMSNALLTGNSEKYEQARRDLENPSSELGRSLFDFSNVETRVSRQRLSGRGQGETKDPADPQKAIAASNALLRDSIKRALAELDRLYEGHEVGLKEYFATRQQLQEQAIDAEIQQARNELAVTKDLAARRRLEEQIIILSRDRAELGAQAARDQLKAEDELNKALGEVKVQLLELDGRTGAAARARLEEQYLELFKRLEAASDQTGQAMVRNLVDRLVNRAVFDQLSSRVSDITGGLSAAEGSISAQVEAGTLGFTEGERRLREVRQQALADTRALREEMAAYLATLSPESPEYATALASLHALDTDIANISASLQEFRQGAQDAGYNALVSFFENFREGALSAGDALRQLVSDFAAGIYSMLAQITSKRLVSAISNLFSGAKGGQAASVGEGATELSSAAGKTALAGGAVLLGAQALSRSAREMQSAAATLLLANGLGSFGAAHGGGVAGTAGMIRHNISPLVFGAAPRYHGGGVAGLGGLANDEVAAILRRGETIRTKEQEAALGRSMDAARQGPSEPPPTPIIVFGEDQLADALAGKAGERVVVHHVRNNRNRFGDDD